jgi:hypothetical protein
MLQDFFGRSGKQPHNVTPQDIFVYTHGTGLSGKQPSAITVGAGIELVHLLRNLPQDKKHQFDLKTLPL